MVHFAPGGVGGLTWRSCVASSNTDPTQLQSSLLQRYLQGGHNQRVETAGKRVRGRTERERARSRGGDSVGLSELARRVEDAW